MQLHYLGSTDCHKAGQKKAPHFVCKKNRKCIEMTPSHCGNLVKVVVCLKICVQTHMSGVTIQSDVKCTWVQLRFLNSVVNSDRPELLTQFATFEYFTHHHVVYSLSSQCLQIDEILRDDWLDTPIEWVHDVTHRKLADMRFMHKEIDSNEYL